MPGTIPPSSASATIDSGQAIDGEALATGGQDILGWISQVHSLLSDINASLLDLLGRQPTGALSSLADSILGVIGTNLSGLISERVSNTNGTSTNFSNFTAVSGVKNYVKAISIKNTSGTDGYVDFRDGSNGAVLWTVNAPATGGDSIASDMPLFATSANTALAYDVSGALTTVLISVSGFQAA